MVWRGGHGRFAASDLANAREEPRHDRGPGSAIHVAARALLEGDPRGAARAGAPRCCRRRSKPDERRAGCGQSERTTGRLGYRSGYYVARSYARRQAGAAGAGRSGGAVGRSCSSATSVARGAGGGLTGSTSRASRPGRSSRHRRVVRPRLSVSPSRRSTSAWTRAWPRLPAGGWTALRFFLLALRERGLHGVEFAAAVPDRRRLADRSARLLAAIVADHHAGLGRGREVLPTPSPSAATCTSSRRARSPAAQADDDCLQELR